MTAIVDNIPKGTPCLRITKRDTHTSIWVTFDKVGFHKYPDAPEEVKYLRDLHRHIFKFKVKITVHHDDREIEFHMFKNWLLSLYERSVGGHEGAFEYAGALELDYKSCEMLAEELLNKILEKYDCAQRHVLVDVSEDGECGATIESLASEVINIPDAVLAAKGYTKADETQAVV